MRTWHRLLSSSYLPAIRYFQIDQYLKAIDYNYRLLYGYMDQYCKHNGIPLGAHFIYLNFDSILAWWWLYLAETCRRTKTWKLSFYDKIVVFIDWLLYKYIDITQRDGSYQNALPLLHIQHVKIYLLKKCCNNVRQYCSFLTKWPVTR
jgi:hypothetical protein